MAVASASWTASSVRVEVLGEPVRPIAYGMATPVSTTGVWSV